MDAAAGAIAQKALDSLKSVQLWLLFGLLICSLAIWLWPPFFGLLPESVKPYAPMALVAAAILTCCKLVGSVLAQTLERHRQSQVYDRERLLKLYRPLATLFLTRHVTLCTVIGAPKLRHRIEKARAELGSYRRRSVGVKRAWRALFDRQISTGAEFEFGAKFPLSEIVGLAKARAAHADPELLDFVNRADRSLYEKPDRASMTDEEFALFEYIDAEHRRLSARARGMI
jgi:stalled ribosome alternative rescue factor ArfA